MFRLVGHLAQMNWRAALTESCVNRNRSEHPGPGLLRSGRRRAFALLLAEGHSYGSSLVLVLTAPRRCRRRLAQRGACAPTGAHTIELTASTGAPVRFRSKTSTGVFVAGYLPPYGLRELAGELFAF